MPPFVLASTCAAEFVIEDILDAHPETTRHCCIFTSLELPGSSSASDPMHEAPWVWIVHDLNPRAMSPHVKGFHPAQSWSQDFTSITIE